MKESNSAINLEEAAVSIAASDEIAQAYGRLVDAFYDSWDLDRLNSIRARGDRDSKKFGQLNEKEFLALKKAGKQRAKEQHFFHLIRVLFESYAKDPDFAGLPRSDVLNHLKGGQKLKDGGWKMPKEQWVADSYASNTLLFTSPIILSRDPAEDQRSFLYRLNDEDKIVLDDLENDDIAKNGESFVSKIAQLFLEVQRVNVEKTIEKLKLVGYGK